jgi:iron-sulfur cluster repair protein YtfE (RIC family)
MRPSCLPEPVQDHRHSEALARWGLRGPHLVDRNAFHTELSRLLDGEEAVPTDSAAAIRPLLDDEKETMRRLLDDAVILAGLGQQMHGGDDAWPQGVGDELYDLLQDLEGHDAREGRIWGQGIPEIGGGVSRRMLEEHGDIRRRLAALVRITGGYQAPAHACLVWRLLYLLCLKVDHSLTERMRLEERRVFRPALRNRTEA